MSLTNMFEGRRVVLLILIFSAIGLASFASDPGTATLSSTPLLRNEAATNSLIRVQGTVTFIDSARKLIVLQDGPDALALELDSLDQTLCAGDRVELEGKLEPLIPALTTFPWHPTGTAVLSSFETPTNWGNNVLSRVRAVLHPPVTGDYTFWIASDDSSELWLDDGRGPDHARQIALVSSGRWTEPRQWNRYVSQQSQSIHLEAGQPYHLEALGQNTIGQACLAVAWQGPGFEQTIVGGDYVTPWPGEGTKVMASQSRGVLWEYWTNFFSRDLSTLKRTDEDILQFTAVHILKCEKGQIPAPLRIRAEGQLESESKFRMIEIEGRVNFISEQKDGRVMELSHGNARITVRIQSGPDFQAVIPNGSMVTVRGIFEPSRGLNTNGITGTIWVNDDNDINWINTGENWSLVATLGQHELTAQNPDLPAGRIVHAQGRVVARETSEIWRLEGMDTFEGYISSDGTNWSAMGSPVEITMSNAVLAGFAVASHQTNELTVAQFDQVSGLSATLLGKDIGLIHHPGGFARDQGKFVITGSGREIWTRSDQCFFACEPKQGNIEMAAHLDEIKGSDRGAKTALMIRESASSDSAWAGMVLMPDGRVGLQSRPEAGKPAIGAMIMHQSVKWAKLVRRQNSFLVRTQTNSLQLGQTLDVLGRVGWRERHLILNDARTRVVPEIPESSGALSPPVISPNELREVQVAELGLEAERAHRTMRLRGVVTFSGYIGNVWFGFFQDRSGGVQIHRRGEVPPNAIAVGDFVDVTGSPVITGSHPDFILEGVARVGIGEMPEPIPFPTDPAKRSEVYGKWAELEGVVRSAANDGRMWMMTRAGLLAVRVEDRHAVRLTNFVNDVIRARGVVWQTPDPLLLVPSEQFLEIVEPSPKEPFGIPSFPVCSLQTNDNKALGRRLKITGVVTCCRNDFLMVQDESGGVRVETGAAPNVKVGDTIEVVGFPATRRFGMVLSGSLLRPVSGAKSPQPPPFPSENIENPQNNGLLVSVEAVLLEEHHGGEIQSLDVQSGQRVFRASLPKTVGLLPAITPGSRIRLTGVTVVEGLNVSTQDATMIPSPLIGSLEMLLRSPQDVVVVERAPWWNWEYSMAVCVLAVLIFTGAVLWIWALRKRVEKRTRELRETMAKLQKETRISATLAERDRLAGEIHDSIEQGLSAIMMQLEAAVKLVGQPEEIKRYLTMAKNMAGFSRTEVQHAVWDLQSPLLENADLVTALRRVAQEISAGDMPKVTVEIVGTVFPLPSVVEHHLLRIAQEAITNSVKHGNSRMISMLLEYNPDAVILIVRDDGSGFVPEMVSIDGGHFGLQGMRIRAGKINAELVVTSKPAGGTCVRVKVHCNDRDSQGTVATTSINN